MKMRPKIKWSVVIKKYVEEYIRKLGYKEEVKTDGILKELKSLRKELEEISDEAAIDFAIGALSRR